MRRLVFLAPLSLTLLLVACGDGEPLLPADAVLPDGGRYRGEIIDGRLQGPGRLDYSDGSYYQGEFKDGQFNGQGRLTYRDGSRDEIGVRGQHVRAQPQPWTACIRDDTARGERVAPLRGELCIDDDERTAVGRSTFRRHALFREQLDQPALLPH